MWGRKVTGVSWGLFIVVIGVALALQQLRGMDPWSIIALGLGVILVGMNLARRAMGERFGKFSFIVGIVAILIGLGAFIPAPIPLLPAVIILVGLFIVAETIAR
jgi:hypothetical protein